MKEVLLEAKKLGAKFKAEGQELRVTAPPGSLSKELQQKLKLHKAEILEFLLSQSEHNEVRYSQVTPDNENQYKPFPLTDLQHAYWLGRDASIELGNISTHVYLEIATRNLDIERLEHALNKLIARHGMLRTIVESSGEQRTLPEVPQYKIQLAQQSGMAHVEASREAMSHQVFKPDTWPLFEIRATNVDDSETRIHISIDMIIIDASSFAIFFDEWNHLYRHDDELPEIGLSFRDYVLAQKAYEATARYEKSEAWWMNRIDSIPAAPRLPIKADSLSNIKPRFSRRKVSLEKERWDSLKKMAGAHGLTPSTILLAAYCEVLNRWSTASHFTLNFIVSNRQPVHRDINNLVGVFTSVVMQEVDRSNVERSFAEFATDLQKQSTQDMERSDYSGVKVLREWAKRHNAGLQAVMPVVFNSALVGQANEQKLPDNQRYLGEQVYSLVQTSQVYLENHVSEHEGELTLAWDAVDEIFEDNVLDEMFAAYISCINSLIDNPGIWHQPGIIDLPKNMYMRRLEANNTVAEISRDCLHTKFVEQAIRNPDAPAIFSESRNLSYKALLNQSCYIANWLLENDAAPGKPVAIIMRKGWEQVAAVYGILLAGCSYMPVNADLPTARLRELINIGEVKHILVQSDFDIQAVLAEGVDETAMQTLDVQADQAAEFTDRHQRSLAVDPGSLAYVIFTSGTTGVPKGVMIDHRGAVNTIFHINRLFKVPAGARTLCVSSLSFDLSVYDIFGMAEVGGSLVIPSSEKGQDPQHWLELIRKYEVNLWNSAPQLINMLVDNLSEEADIRLPFAIVMMSGDWIPLNLPDRIRRLCADVEVISLGGATEASIWSNYFQVRDINKNWKSIPYGKPLPNQTMWVFDDALRPCPDFVVGRIFIGGIGLALGYWKSEEQTQKRFIRHPESGERYYDTGDLGLYDQDGNIVILGRADRQVKIRGYRVELDEIEAVLNEHEDVKQALVVLTESGSNTRVLAAYINSGKSLDDASGIKDFAASRLPEYMVPQYYAFIEKIPLSSNGKVNYKSLPVISVDSLCNERDIVPATNKTEERLLVLWQRILKEDQIGTTDSFFEFGGDSITAAQLVREINTEFSSRLEMRDFFEKPTIQKLAPLIDTSSTQDQTVDAVFEDPDIKKMSTDIRDALIAFNRVSFDTPLADSSAPSAVLVTGATGWLGMHLLAELLLQTSAKIYCLIQDANKYSSEIILARLREKGYPIPDNECSRIELLAGGLEKDNFGLGLTVFRNLSNELDVIYHLAADVNVMFDYQYMRERNVLPLNTLLRLATVNKRKKIIFASPMNVCMRRENGRVVVHAHESVSETGDGLLTGYAKSKWVSERVLFEATDRGLPVTIFRSSHALPSTLTGECKPRDTFMSILKLAQAAESIPEENSLSIRGMPVDLLAKKMVAHALASTTNQAVVHIDNQTPPILSRVVSYMAIQDVQNNIFSFNEWLQHCLSIAERSDEEFAMLANSLLRSHGGAPAPILHMFGNHTIDQTSLADSVSGTNEVDLSLEYWRQVSNHKTWKHEN